MAFTHNTQPSSGTVDRNELDLPLRAFASGVRLGSI